jgi:ABC-type antimicrobial peptide transport system permease subunit
MSLDREAPMFQIRTGDQLAAAAVTIPRFVSVLMTGFAGVALLLTVVGLYGILSSAVAKRRREIGVRMAVGAGRRQVLGLVMREAMQLVVLGLAFGLAGAIGVQRLLASIAFGIRSQDFVFVAAACCVMVVTSVAAAWLPALSAVSVDPVQALRTE